jgi:glycosyltransferase involved in cell wall biosynthesis
VTLEQPLVSVVLTTRDRPRFLATALRCYQQQTYPCRELIVVDDGTEAPADESAVAAVAGRLLRVEPGMILGDKLNAGFEQARGPLSHKMDDDDWYAPGFLASMVSTLLDSWQAVCRPTLAFLMPFLFFDLAHWEIRRSIDNNAPGASFLFPTSDWQEHHFRSLPRDEDVWFLLDEARMGGQLLPVPALDTFLAVRHNGLAQDRDHTWTRQLTGEVLEDYLHDRPLYELQPEAMLPDWAVAFYWQLHLELVQAASASNA